MATTEVLPVTFPGWVTFTLPTGDTTTARASLHPRGIAIDLPAGPALAMLDPDHVEKALALVLETCEDAAEAHIYVAHVEIAEALSRFSAAWRGTSID